MVWLLGKPLVFPLKETIKNVQDKGESLFYELFSLSFLQDISEKWPASNEIEVGRKDIHQLRYYRQDEVMMV